MQDWTNKRDYILFGKISMERRYWHYDEYGMRFRISSWHVEAV